MIGSAKNEQYLTLVLCDPEVDGQHLKMFFDKGRYYAVDVSKAKSTYFCRKSVFDCECFRKQPEVCNSCNEVYSESIMSADLRQNSKLILECGGSSFVIKNYSFESQQKIDKLLLRLFLQEKGANSIFNKLWKADIQTIRQLKDLRLEDIRRLKLDFSELEKLIDEDEASKDLNETLTYYHVVAIKDLDKREKRFFKIRRLIRYSWQLLFRRKTFSFGKLWLEISGKRGLSFRQTLSEFIRTRK